MKDNIQYINSLDRGLRIIEMIIANGSLGTTEAGEYLDINKSSAYRLLSTLERRGYIKQDSISKKYKIGIKLIEIGEKALSHIDIVHISKPYLHEMAITTGETSHLGILSGYSAVLIAQEIGKEMINVNTRVGMNEPACISAIGRAIISYLPEKEQKDLINELIEKNEKTNMDITRLNIIIRETKERGYAIDDEELFSGIRCIAAPIFDHRQYPIASIGISGPSSRMTLRNMNQYSKNVRKISNIISNELGGDISKINQTSFFKD